MGVSEEDTLRLNLSGKIPRLEDYGVSPRTAFMNENPLRKLPSYFDPWWNIAKTHDELVQDGSFRDMVHEMPFLDYRCLDSEAEWCLAHTVLCCISQCYMWCEGESNIPQYLPEKLAVPLWEVSQYLGITVSICQFSFVLHNWEFIDPNGPMTADNMRLMIQLTGGQDEDWFFMISGQIEADCGPALCGVIQAQQAVKDLDVNKYISALETTEKVIRKMTSTLLRMREKCRPWYFYNVIRPFTAGSDSPAYKEKGWKGLIFQGVSSKPLCYSGGSAAQSSTLPSLDAALGIVHKQSEEEQCATFRQCMPPMHRNFITALADGPSIREFASFSKNSRALQVYNACLSAITEFRSSHIQIATEYIIAMSRRKDADKKYAGQGATMGTGGTGFMRFLKGIRSSVYTALYQDDEGTEIN